MIGPPIRVESVHDCADVAGGRAGGIRVSAVSQESDVSRASSLELPFEILGDLDDDERAPIVNGFRDISGTREIGHAMEDP